MDIFKQTLIFIFYILLSFYMTKLVYRLCKYNRYVVLFLPSIFFILSVVLFVIGFFLYRTYLEDALLVLFIFIGSVIASVEQYMRKH